MLRIAPTQVRDLALGLVELHGPTPQGSQSQDPQNSIGPDDIIYVLFLIFCYAHHLCSYWLVTGMVQEWKQAMSCWITVSSAKAEVLLLKMIISDMSLILHYLPESQTQTWGGTDRWAQGALTEEPVVPGLLRELDSMLPAAQEALPFQPSVLLTELSL